MAEPVWDRAAATASLDERRRPEIASLRRRADLPDLATLFAFMRDAELRFRTLRLRIEDRTWGSSGEQVATIDVAVRHPGRARVTTRRTAADGSRPRYETWLSDGQTVWTYTSESKVATVRPVRKPPLGAESPLLPGRSRVYVPLTPLPKETLPETFVHPAGFCQNVLATGRVWVATSDRVAGREAIVIECDHPRSVLVVADRPDHHLSVAADVETGIVLRLVESLAGVATRDASVVALEVDPEIPDSTFEAHAPPEARRVY